MNRIMKQQWDKLGRGVAVALLGWMLAGSFTAARATLINFDINGYDSLGSTVGPTYSGAQAVGSAGDFWNSVAVDNDDITTFTAWDLKLSDGATTTTVDFTVTSGSAGKKLVAFRETSYTIDDLYNDGLTVWPTMNSSSPTNIRFTIEGLNPGNSYDLYLYSSPGAYGNDYAFSTFIIGTTTNQNPAGPPHYVTFTGLQADGNGKITGTLYEHVITGGNPGILNGFQLVGEFTTIVPEPSMALLFAGGLGVLWCWRRARRS